jgi:voltage-gated potassium channel
MIFANVTIFILSTVETIRLHSTNILLAFECLTIIIFMLEYGLRLWCIVEKAKYGKMGLCVGRIAHVFTFGSIIDLVSIVPFWVDMILTIRAHNNLRFYDVRVLSSLRILRIFRLFKADKYTASLEVIVQVFKSKSRVLGITGVMGLILFLFTSTALYFAQGPVDPELSSIPASFYTAALLLTGQGYWNPAPVTPAGKWVVAISNVFSVAVFAIPAGILASGLEPIGEEVHDRRKAQRMRRNKAFKAAKDRERKRRVAERTMTEATLVARDRTNINIDFTSDEDFSGPESPLVQRRATTQDAI